MAVLIVFLSFFMFSSSPVLAQQQGSQKPLAQLVQLALENSPTIASARKSFETAQLQRKNATAALLPSLDLEANHGYADSNPRVTNATSDLSTNSVWTSGLNLRLTEKFYDNGESLAKRQMALRAEARAEAEFNWTRDQALKEIAEAFYLWSQSLQGQKIEQSRLELLKTQYKIMRGQFRQGMKTKRDVLRIESALRKSEIDLLRAKNEVTLNQLKVASLVGVSTERLNQAGVLPAEPLENWTPPETKGPLNIKNHVRGKILALGLEESQIEADFKKRAYWPELFLEGLVGYGTANYLGTSLRPEDNDGVNWSTMLTLKFNLFDFGIRRREAQIAKVASRIVEDSNRKAMLDLESELNATFISLKEARETIRMSQELLSLEQASFKAIERDFRDGRTGYLDLIENLKSLFEARINFVSSYFGYKIQLVNYELHQGRIYEHLKAE